MKINNLATKVDKLSITIVLLAIKVERANNKIDYVVLNQVDQHFTNITNPQTIISQLFVGTCKVTNPIGIIIKFILNNLLSLFLHNQLFITLPYKKKYQYLKRQHYHQYD